MTHSMGIYGRLNFWFQELQIPKGVLDEVRKIIYAFIWDGIKEYMEAYGKN